MSYKALSLTWILRGALDFQVVNLNRLSLSTPGGSTNMLASVLNYWTPTNPTNDMTALGIGPASAVHHGQIAQRGDDPMGCRPGARRSGQ